MHRPAARPSCRHHLRSHACDATTVTAATAGAGLLRARARRRLRPRRLWVGLALCALIAFGIAALPVGDSPRPVARRVGLPRATAPQASELATRPTLDTQPDPWAGLSDKFRRKMHALDDRMTELRHQRGIEGVRSVVTQQLHAATQMERLDIIVWATTMSYAWCADLLFDHLSTTDATDRRSIAAYMAGTPTPRGGWRPDPAAVDRLIVAETDSGIALDLADIRAWCAR